MKKIKILIADDHQIFREGIISLLKEIQEFEIDESIDGKDALERLKTEPYDILIADLSMPDVSGFELLKKIKEFQLNVRILILSMHTHPEVIFQTVRQGAHGFLPKEETRKEDLIKAIYALYQGQEYYHESVKNTLNEYFLNKARNQTLQPGIHALTRREKEVLKWVVEGLSNQEIADKLFVNIRTIESHKSNILQKLGLKNTVELVKFAIRHHLVDPY